MPALACTLIWHVLLGPAAALTYRLLVEERCSGRKARWIGWWSAYIVVALLAVAGNCKDTLGAWHYQGGKGGALD